MASTRVAKVITTIATIAAYFNASSPLSLNALLSHQVFGVYRGDKLVVLFSFLFLLILFPLTGSGTVILFSARLSTTCTRKKPLYITTRFVVSVVFQNSRVSLYETSHQTDKNLWRLKV